MSVTRRNRAVPADLFTDERLIELPAAARLTAVGLRFFADDEGRASANPALILAGLFPLAPDMTPGLIEEHLLMLAETHYIRLYEAQGREWLVLVDWPKVDRGKRTVIPAPPNLREEFAVGGGRGRRSRAGGEEGEGEGDGRGGTGLADGARRGSGPEAATDAMRALREMLRGAPEVSPFCPKHQPRGTTQPCGPCGSARKQHEQWIRAQTEEEGQCLNESR
jgi:hypothetical protein